MKLAPRVFLFYYNLFLIYIPGVPFLIVGVSIGVSREAYTRSNR